MLWSFPKVRTWVRRGYEPPPQILPTPEWVVEPPQDGDGEWLLLFCPTYVAPTNESAQCDAIEGVLRQLSEGLRRQHLPRSVFMVGMQHGPDGSEEARRRLLALDAIARRHGVAFCAFSLATFGKVKSLNVALQVANRRRAFGLLQVDDDVRLDDDCLVHLFAAFAARGRRGAVGATKIGLARRGGASRMLRWAKARTRPACNYPHACCLLLDPTLFPEGIPIRFVSDDGYICFSLLRPREPDPWSMLQLVPAARCFHYIGGAAGRSVQRIRRLLLNHHIYIAAFPEDVGRFYVREILFPGFWPVGTAARGTRPLTWCLQALYFSAFCAIGLELAIRGCLGYPLRAVNWAGFDDRGAPAVQTNLATAEGH
jgi:hypothetical protein